MFTPALGLTLFIITLFAITSTLVLINQQSAANIALTQKTRMSTFVDSTKIQIQQSTISGVRDTFNTFFGESSCERPILTANKNTKWIFDSSKDFEDTAKDFSANLLGDCSEGLLLNILRSIEIKSLGAATASYDINFVGSSFEISTDMTSDSTARCMAISSMTSGLETLGFCSNDNFNACLSSNAILNIIDCDNSGCDNGSIVIRLDFDKIESRVREKLAGLKIVSGDAETRISVIPTQKMYVLIPLRIYKAIHEASEEIKLIGDHSGLIFGTAGTTATGFMPTMDLDDGIRLGNCGSGCASQGDTSTTNCVGSTYYSCTPEITNINLKWKIGTPTNQNNIHLRNNKYDSSEPGEEIEQIMNALVCNLANYGFDTSDPDFIPIEENSTDILEKIGNYDFDICQNNSTFAFISDNTNLSGGIGISPLSFNKGIEDKPQFGYNTDTEPNNEIIPEWKTKKVCEESQVTGGKTCTESLDEEFTKCARPAKLDVCIGLKDTKEGYSKGEGTNYFFKVDIKPTNYKDYFGDSPTTGYFGEIDTKVKALTCETDSAESNLNRCKIKTIDDIDPSVDLDNRVVVLGTCGATLQSQYDCCPAGSSLGKCAA